MRSGGDHRVCSMSSRVAFKLRACTTSHAIPPSRTSAIERGTWAYVSDMCAYCTGRRTVHLLARRGMQPALSPVRLEPGRVRLLCECRCLEMVA